MTAAILLIVVGGLGQMVGVGLLIWDVKAILDYSRTVTGRIAQVLPALEMDAAGRIEAHGGRVPSAEERLDQVERDLSDLQKQVGQLPTQLETRWLRDIEGRIQRLEESLRERFGRMETVVIGAAGSNAKRLRWSIILIVGGVAASTVGSLLAIGEA